MSKTKILKNRRKSKKAAMYSVSKGCCGSIFFGPCGSLCGLLEK